MRCPKCGNENSEGNRFCGMCGGSLISAPPPGAAVPVASRSEKTGEAAGGRFSDERRLPSRPAPAAPPPEPSVAGPSFLGLNKPGDGQRGRQDLHGRSSRSVDYLLEDDEDNEPNGGRGKILLVLIALVLAGVFGYLYWRQGGFDWVLKGNKTTPVAQTSPEASAPSATPSPATSDSGASTQSATPNSASGNASSPSTANNTSVTPAPENPSPSASAAPAQPTVPADNTAPQNQTSAPDDNAASTKAATPSQEKSPSEKAADQDDESTTEPAETTKPAPAPKRIRKPTPATPLDLSAEADRYIYGRGVTQDCDRGLRLLKSAAQNEAKAMIQLGVLYSSGTCAPRDLPTAYRWFAMALHKDPNNQAVQDDLQQLWGQMTQPERQLAIKLSQ